MRRATESRVTRLLTALVALASASCATSDEHEGEAARDAGAEDGSLADSALPCSTCADASDTSAPDALSPPVADWIIFNPARGTSPASSSAVHNPSFELGAPGLAQDWSPFGDGYAIDETGGHGAGRALKLVSTVATQVHGASSVVTLQQTAPRPLYVSAWNRAADVSGAPDLDYAVYLDIHYTDGTNLFGVTLPFDAGTHDWQFRDRFVVAERPIDRVDVFCLLRNTHTGTAWFDDVVVREAPPGVSVFDGQVVAVAPSPTIGAPLSTLTTTDGLEVGLASGGAVPNVSLRGVAVQDAARAFAGGFFVHDVRDEGDWVHPGGTLSESAGAVVHVADVASLGLSFKATYTARADRIDVHGELTDTRGTDRAITLYFALPLATDGWIWGDDVRSDRVVTGLLELSNFSHEWDIGAIGSLSRYPWGVVSGPNGGVVMAYGLAEPRVARIVDNPSTHQLYAAFDLGLTADTKNFPSKAWVDLTLYRVDSQWGFRAATQGYYDRYPSSFTRRIPPAREGIWMPFTSLSSIPNPSDFGFGVHELAGLGDVAADDALGVASLRYVSEPWSHWMGISASGFNPKDPSAYNQVVAYLQDRFANGTPQERRQAEATLSSAFFDANGHYFYRGYGPGEVPWCAGSAGCALFAVSGDPNIHDSQYPLNKANLDWSAEAQAAYSTTPGLDGEYIDSVQDGHFRLLLDQRRSHWATSRQPVTFQGGRHELGIPSLFATMEFLHWLEPQLHGKGRLLMGNTVLEGLPWGADVFDYMGVETGWLSGGQLVPPSDSDLLYRRTLSGKRPYGFLMNTDFTAMGKNGNVERYFQTCLFYGIYPSFFSPNAASDPYWASATFYERDRALFVKYIPLIRQINVAGWVPIPNAHSSGTDVLIERYGAWPEIYLALRSTRSTQSAVTVTLDDALGLPQQSVHAKTLVVAGLDTTIPPGQVRTVTVTLPAQAVDIVRIGP